MEINENISEELNILNHVYRFYNQDKDIVHDDTGLFSKNTKNTLFNEWNININHITIDKPTEIPVCLQWDMFGKKTVALVSTLPNQQTAINPEEIINNKYDPRYFKYFIPWYIPFDEFTNPDSDLNKGINGYLGMDVFKYFNTETRLHSKTTSTIWKGDSLPIIYRRIHVGYQWFIYNPNVTDDGKVIISTNAFINETPTIEETWEFISSVGRFRKDSLVVTRVSFTKNLWTYDTGRIRIEAKPDSLLYIGAVEFDVIFKPISFLPDYLLGFIPDDIEYNGSMFTKYLLGFIKPTHTSILNKPMIGFIK